MNPAGRLPPRAEKRPGSGAAIPVLTPFPAAGRGKVSFRRSKHAVAATAARYEANSPVFSDSSNAASNRTSLEMKWSLTNSARASLPDAVAVQKSRAS